MALAVSIAWVLCNRAIAIWPLSILMSLFHPHGSISLIEYLITATLNTLSVVLQVEAIWISCKFVLELSVLLCWQVVAVAI